MSLLETKTTEFVISRVFDAPRELVWKCFTDPEHMKQWWGPKGITVPVATMDLRPGGIFHYRMDGQRPADVGQDGLSRNQSARPDRLPQLVLGRGRRHHASSDGADLAAGDALDLHVRGRARRQDPVHGPLVAAQCDGRGDRRTFDAGHDSMRQGWGGTFDKLAAYLPKAK